MGTGSPGSRLVPGVVPGVVPSFRLQQISRWFPGSPPPPPKGGGGTGEPLKGLPGDGNHLLSGAVRVRGLG